MMALAGDLLVAGAMKVWLGCLSRGCIMATSSRAWSLSGVRISDGDWRLSVGEMGVFPLYWSSRVPPLLPTLRLRPNLLSFIESLERDRGFSSDWVSVTTAESFISLILS